MTATKTLTAYHGKPTDVFQSITSRNAQPDEFTGETRISKKGVTVELDHAGGNAGILGVRTGKLLLFSIVEFTRLNGYGKNKNIIPAVSFSLKDYCSATGYRITGGNERQKLKNAGQQIKADLLTLQAARITWKDRKNFECVSIISRTAIKGGIVEIEFSRTVAKYLHNKPLATFPAELLKISGNSFNAFSIAYKIILHSQNKNNQSKGTADRLKVSTLLAAANLPDYETVLGKGNSWRARIKQPLENALNEIQAAGIIRAWKYDRPQCLESYKAFADTVVIFDLLPNVKSL